MKIFIINLERSVDRKEHMLKEIEKLKGDKDFQKYEFIFFKAIDSTSKEFAEFKNKYFSPYTCYMFHGRVMTDNEIACYASHFSLWQECIRLNEPIIVLEDDIIIESNFFSALDEIQNSKFSFVRGYFCDKNRDKFARQIGNSHFYYALKNLSGTQGYYITPRAAAAFSAAKKWEYPVDAFIEWGGAHKIDNIIYKPFFVSESELSPQATISRSINQNVPRIYKILRPFYRSFIAIKRFIFKLFYRAPKL
ncbi:lipooligosaccharide biosynthesis glycosyltransferase [Helicobacter saguini]|uniref:Lipooligosaccharide biosynthesis glycosyltransferase n=1 Tax=Helicobacter saguini TaxID=1548018 RepID=A0A347VKI6_9HELI|nr:glycosyltransferase family 25 protein [Helicobacter saguini]MWV61153.1 lipooligosaccharide biosynthesis glycosyltransferase [Helicobacter saguini]MWV68178.1 lipooligosaccharide biosynthesis glycosyltransferase [Helicobacter saguini]MWV70358.1 lipooligosaccharide biosynthesis glycosyltransferase [Helicobacter saguini]MWV72260.1 lipooligosaccharide biosynthesis glycosyltransferase [Helicobacter saguini]TLD95305.1 lipooligosaccharide biosynthesis glycosyltransferase [Helicobacter saguini]